MAFYDIPISYQFGGVEDTIHPALLADGRHMVLVDCGFVGFLSRLEAAAAEKGLDLARLTHVIITHHDHDHMGALHALKAKYPAVQVVAGFHEAPYISGREKPLRLVQAEQMQASLPANEKAFGEAFIGIVKQVLPVPVDIVVADGQVLDVCGGITVIATPGHTPGHISLYAREEKILIAGDAAALENGQPVLANPQFALDRQKAQESMEKILAWDAKAVLFYHGGWLPKE